MPTLELGCYPPHEKQLEFLEKFRRQQPGVAVTHYVGGRGSGKTLIACLALLESCTTFNVGLPHLWTSPTYPDCRDTFLRTWESLVPAELYTLNKNDMTIHIHNTGGSLVDIRSRQVTNGKREAFRGPTYAGAVLDEPRQDSDNTAWSNIRATVRHPGAHQKWMITSSTPRMNWYYDLVVEGKAPAIYGSSYDNVYLDRDFIEGLAGDLSPQMAQQEIYAEWVSLSDRIWPNVNLDEEWPNGNMHPHMWDPSLPFTLAGDIGLKSAWLIIQHVDGVDVAVGEYTPGRQGTEQTLNRIEEDYGIPSRVIVGSDWNTGSVQNGASHALYFRSRGWANRVQPVPPGTIYARKDYQYTAANRLILNSRDERKFCISQHLRSHDPEYKCGIRELFLRDTWPDKVIRYGEFLPKDKTEKGTSALEDIRDCFMYFCMMTHPIRSVKQPLAA